MSQRCVHPCWLSSKNNFYRLHETVVEVFSLNQSFRVILIFNETAFVLRSVCRGFNKNGKKHEINFITETTIRNLINCTIIEGNLVILSMTFKGIMEFSDDKYVPPPSPLNSRSSHWLFFLRTVEQRWHDGVTPADLEQLSTIKEITGYFRIDASHSDMSSLSFLRNLEYIRGRTVEE